MLVLLILAAIADLGLLALLIGISGFIFGGGPEGMHGDPAGVAAWSAGALACLAAPVGGFVLRSYGKDGAGVIAAWLPPVGALLLAAL